MPSVKIIDRHLIASFLTAYVICFTSMVGLYVIIDLFTNADEFIEDHAGTAAFVRRAAKYYYVHSFEYFARLSPVITMIAAMTTLAALHRHNEIVALLAAGIPTKRALRPILLGVLFMIALGAANREIALPYYAEVLQRLHEDIEATQVLIPSMHIDEDHVLFRAKSAHREDQRLESLNVTLPLEIAGQLQEVECPSAYYRPDPETGRLGWLLVQPSPVQLTRPSSKIKKLDDGSLFIFSNVSFSDMIRRSNWRMFAGTGELLESLHGRDLQNAEELRTQIHSRFMQPILNLLLVLLGIPFVLQWERRNIYRSIAVSMVLCGLFYVVDTTSGYFANHGYVDPMTAAWTPVFLFAPLATSMFHRMGT